MLRPNDIHYQHLRYSLRADDGKGMLIDRLSLSDAKTEESGSSADSCSPRLHRPLEAVGTFPLPSTCLIASVMV